MVLQKEGGGPLQGGRGRSKNQRKKGGDEKGCKNKTKDSQGRAQRDGIADGSVGYEIQLRLEPVKAGDTTFIRTACPKKNNWGSPAVGGV